MAVAVTLSTVAASPAGSAGAAPSGGTIPKNINTSKLVGNQAEQTVAVNPTNRKNIVVLANSAGGLFEGYTFDGGATWTSQTISDACCDPSLAFDGFGNLFMSYLYGSLPDDVPVKVSTDGGKTFTLVGNASARGDLGAVPHVGRGAAGGRAGFADQPSITAGAGAVWVSYTAGDGHIVAAGATVTGLGQVGTLAPREEVAGTNGAGDYGDVVIGPHGQVVVSYQFPTGGEGPSTMWTAIDRDGLGPKGFGTPRPFGTTNVGGFDYIPAQSTRSVDVEFNLAYDRTGGVHDGRLYAIWLSENPDESNDMDVMFQHSDDNGKTWSTAVRVNDDAGKNSQFNPAIAVDQSSGHVGIAWFDCRKDHGTGGKGDTNGIPNDDAQFWGAVSTDGGATFSANIQISKGTSNAFDAHNGTDYGDYTHAAFAGGLFVPVWSDNSNSTGDNPSGALQAFDVYIAKIAA
jgi:hypothetical protein